MRQRANLGGHSELPVYPLRLMLSMNFALPLMFCRIQRLLPGKGIKSCPFNVVIEVISRSSLRIIARVILSKRTTETV